MSSYVAIFTKQGKSEYPEGRFFMLRTIVIYDKSQKQIISKLLENPGTQTTLRTSDPECRRLPSVLCLELELDLARFWNQRGDRLKLSTTKIIFDNTLEIKTPSSLNSCISVNSAEIFFITKTALHKMCISYKPCDDGPHVVAAVHVLAEANLWVRAIRGCHNFPSARIWNNWNANIIFCPKNNQQINRTKPLLHFFTLFNIKTHKRNAYCLDIIMYGVKLSKIESTLFSVRYLYHYFQIIRDLH